MGVIEDGEVYALVVVSDEIWGRVFNIVIGNHESIYK